jgi:hypothetical protein
LSIEYRSDTKIGPKPVNGSRCVGLSWHLKTCKNNGVGPMPVHKSRGGFYIQFKYRSKTKGQYLCQGIGPQVSNACQSIEYRSDTKVGPLPVLGSRGGFVNGI